MRRNLTFLHASELMAQLPSTTIKNWRSIGLLLPFLLGTSSWSFNIIRKLFLGGKGFRHLFARRTGVDKVNEVDINSLQGLSVERMGGKSRTKQLNVTFLQLLMLVRLSAFSMPMVLQKIFHACKLPVFTPNWVINPISTASAMKAFCPSLY